MSKSEILLTFPFCKMCSRVLSTEKIRSDSITIESLIPKVTPPNLSFKFPQKKGWPDTGPFFQNFPSMCLGAELMPGSGIAFKNVALIIAEGFRLDFGMPKNHQKFAKGILKQSKPCNTQPRKLVVLMKLRIFIWDFEIEIKRYFSSLRIF